MYKSLVKLLRRSSLPRKEVLQTAIAAHVPAPVEKNTRRGQWAPIFTLPEELTCQIFEDVMGQLRDLPFERFCWPATISTVCKRWRLIAINLPSLWDTIIIDLNFRTRKLDLHIPTRLLRSKLRPLNVELTLLDPDPVTGLNGERYQHSRVEWPQSQTLMLFRCLQKITEKNVTDRMRRLVVKTYRSHDWGSNLLQPEQLFLDYFSDLISRRRCCFPELEEMVLGRLSPLKFVGIIQRAPRIRHLAFFGSMMMCGDLNGMLRPYGSRLSRLEHLHIQCSHWGYGSDWQISAVLSCCCALRTLYIGGGCTDQMMSPRLSSPSSSQLLCLGQLMELRFIDIQWEFVYYIVKMIKAPDLEKLALCTSDYTMSIDPWEGIALFHPQASFSKLTHVVVDTSHHTTNLLPELSEKAPNVRHLTILPYHRFTDLQLLVHPNGEYSRAPFPRLETLTIGKGLVSLMRQLRMALENRLIVHPDASIIRQINISSVEMKRVSGEIDCTQDDDLARASAESLRWLESYSVIKTYGREGESTLSEREAHMLCNDISYDLGLFYKQHRPIRGRNPAWYLT